MLEGNKKLKMKRIEIGLKKIFLLIHKHYWVQLKRIFRWPKKERLELI